MQTLDFISVALYSLCDLTIQREVLLILDVCVLRDKSPQINATPFPVLKIGGQGVGACQCGGFADENVADMSLKRF